MFVVKIHYVRSSGTVGQNLPLETLNPGLGAARDIAIKPNLLLHLLGSVYPKDPFQII